MGHSGYPFGPDDIDVGIMGLLGRQLPVDMPLGDVEHYSVGECSVALQPPGVFICPHAHRLGVAGFEFGVCEPPGCIDIVHSTVVECGAFSLVSLSGSQAGGHVAHTEDGEVAKLSRCDALVEFPQIP